ncbi:DUF551 domain-containing protein [Pseudomonas sp. 22-AL-CL-001]|uniref:DUF551 domain-containing protein n=1 Tax=Pseudomonas alabamensis TaxID=3064349 RepID=UPI00271307C1|nr:DUF551 domain-containing protein [Pseudomonas sp. 22-AL-CL-001]MDO7911377.1 DUF551 domain-containing protein [Pseudomonas sp. 22-AL-CL-001]
MSSWIKCEDQMPEQLLSVLAAGKGGKIFNLYRHDNRWFVDGPFNGQRQDGEVKFPITHWQPLPSPPTE